MRDESSSIVSVKRYLLPRLLPVNWGKSKNKTQKPQKTALTDTPVPKKNNTVVSTEDGFEIKLCNFKSLSNKKDNPDNKIKKK